MKKILSIFIIFAFLISGCIPINALAESSFFFFESFENEAMTGWLINGTVSDDIKTSFNTAIKSEGKNSFYILDKSATELNHNHSGYIEVVPGTNFKFLIDAYMVSGSVKAMLRYYTDKKETLASHTIKMSGMINTWYTHSLFSTVPSDAKYVMVWIYTDTGQLGEGYFDNVRISENFDITNSEIIMDPPKQADAVNATIVQPSGSKLIYNKYTDKGDTLSDFSYAGYYAGEYELPDTSKLSQFKTLYPAEELADDTLRIQTVINNANKEYVKTGKMQVVNLTRGKYNINSSGLDIKSGVVLRGESQSSQGTVLYAYEPVKHNVLNISGSYPKQVGEIAYVMDKYIPSGSKTLAIESSKVSQFAVGDLVTVYHPNDENWNIAMGMKGDNMTYTSGTVTNNTSWDPGEVDMKTERTITKISGNKITLDFPLFVPYDTNYSKVYIYKTDDSGRRENIGIENLRIESYYDGTLYDENHAYIAIYFLNAKNCFVRDVSTKYMWYSFVSCQSGAKQITVKNCSSLSPVSEIDGSRRYTFYTGSKTQQNLFIGCYSFDGRHDYSTSYQSTGPNAFVDSVVDESNSESETHGTWSTGVLYDSIMQIGNASLGSIATMNRGYYGSTLSQGWSGAGVVMWNCLSNTLMAHKPPLNYQNFIVGQWGYYDDKDADNRKKGNISSAKSIYKTNDIPAGTVSDSAFATKDGTSFVGDAYKESEFAPVEPRSLYKSQLAYRITNNYKNAKPNAPVIISPRSDATLETNAVTVKGLYQQDADAVTVYIDDVPYQATLSGYTFNYFKTLSNGTHKIYATQTIDGVEGNKTADRFIVVKEEGTWQDYLSSDTNSELAKVILEDQRLSYDEYERGVLGDIPDKLEQPIATFAGVADLENSITVNNHNGEKQVICNPFGVAVTRVPEIKNNEIIEYGVLMSDNHNDVVLKNTPLYKSYTELNNDMAYGILFYGPFETNKDYYVRAYVLYKDIKGVTSYIYSDIYDFKISE